MRNELSVFLAAVQFYTRIPIPGSAHHHSRDLQESTRYLPVIGWLIGGAASGVLLAALGFYSIHVAVILSMITSVLLTGALHEDGLSDACDGFGGGWTPERILEIMKDSRIGVCGAVGLVLVLLLKLFITVELVRVLSLSGTVVGLTIISSHSLSRFSASLIMAFCPCVRPAADSKMGSVKPPSGLKHSGIIPLWIAGLLALLPLGILGAVLNSFLLMAVLIPVGLATLYLGMYFLKRIGGYTGDCLGAAQQISEIVFLMAVAGLWKFI